MTRDGRQALDAVIRLREALEGTSAALAGADLAALLRSEAVLESALGGGRPAAPLGQDDRLRLRDEIAAARRALRRCQRLGGALVDTVRAGLEAQGRSTPYARPGAARPSFTPHSVDARG
jgi:hypothetical protein